MTTVKIILFLIYAGGTCLAQYGFQFQVYDRIRNEKLQYDVERKIMIDAVHFQNPHLDYSIEYQIFGINQDEFTINNKTYQGSISRKDYENFLEEARKLPLKSLELGDPLVFGRIDLDGKKHKISAAQDMADRMKWQTFLDGILKKHAPESTRNISRKTVEGDTVKARVIDLSTLLKDPKKFDGKRIRLAYPNEDEDEDSVIAASRENFGLQPYSYSHTLKLADPSTFADSKHISLINEKKFTVEGTFDLRQDYSGELQRLTVCRETDAEPLEPVSPPSQPAVEAPVVDQRPTQESGKPDGNSASKLLPVESMGFAFEYSPANFNNWGGVRHEPRLTSQEIGTGIPIGNAPESIMFTLTSQPSKLLPLLQWDYSRKARIQFIPLRDATVPDYKAAYPALAHCTDEIQSIIKGKTPHLKTEECLPDLSCVDYTQTIHSKVQVVKTPWCSGIQFITQYAQESDGIDNSNLEYVFQGVSKDRKFYIAAWIPMAHIASAPCSLPRETARREPQAMQKSHRCLLPENRTPVKSTA